MNKLAMITGATAGIGEATAHLYAQNGYDLIITGRRDNLLQTLKNKLENQYGIEVLTLCFDVRDKEAVNNSISNLEDKWRNIGILINNAGLAKGFHDIQDGNIEDWETMIDTNIKGLLYVSRQIMPIMIKNHSGHVFVLELVAISPRIDDAGKLRERAPLHCHLRPCRQWEKHYHRKIDL